MKINSTTLIFSSAFVLSAFLTGCSEQADDTANKDEGDIYVSLTDAEGDFSQYQVDVTALKLYKANGSVIETLPNTTTIDFAQYVDVTEFLSTASVPTGFYTKAEITLNYDQAQLSVENASGESIPATAFDEDNNALSSVTLTTFINGNQGFAIRKGQPISLTIDFDLESSNEVDVNDTGDSATVTVNPVLVANTTFDDDKERRLRGLLASVDTTENTYDVNIRPFQTRHHDFGKLTVQADDQTVYEINGESYDATTGLEELAKLDATAAIITLGMFDFDSKQFYANEVFAGSSVPWNDKDTVKGSVVARSGNTLTILGATLELDDGQFTFNDQVTVLVDADTKVSKQGSTEAVDINDLSIGQRVIIIGDAQNDDTFDATSEEGIVRMRYSDITGTVALASPLQVDVQHMNRRHVSNFDFTGTGSDSSTDADPTQYEINTSTLSLSHLNDGSAVKVRGFVNEFATAPEDFTAKSIMDVSHVNTKMFINYGRSGSSTAVTSLDDNGLQLDISSATGRHYLNQFGVITDLADLASVPVIIPNDNGRTLFTLNQGKSLRVFTNWNNFQTALNEALNEGKLISLVHSSGLYDGSELDFTSRHLVIRLVSAS